MPWYHYIPVPDATGAAGGQTQSDVIEDLLTFFKTDNNGLGEKSGKFIAQRIAHNGRKFIEEQLKMSDIEAYWYALLSKYSKLLDFQPSLNKDFIKIVK